MSNFTNFMEVEDCLQEFGVFANPFTNQTCHSDSYGTIVLFDKLDKALDHIVVTYPTILQELVTYWTTNTNMQPPLRLVGFTLARRLASKK